MNERLKESINHWERLLAAATARNASQLDEEGCGSDVCACCIEYMDRLAGTCLGCPIFEHTGEPHCRNTPYNGAEDAIREILWDYMVTDCAWDTAIDTISAELEFLRNVSSDQVDIGHGWKEYEFLPVDHKLEEYVELDDLLGCKHAWGMDENRDDSISEEPSIECFRHAYLIFRKRKRGFGARLCRSVRRSSSNYRIRSSY